MKAKKEGNLEKKTTAAPKKMKRKVWAQCRTRPD
jgi:hypothetical protein